MNATQLREPRSGITTATTSASPITKIGVSSTAATTTYTATTVADATAWDLSAITAGEIVLGVWAVTSENYRGRVTAVNDTTDTVTIAGGWITPEGNQIDPNISTKTPTNATAVTLHRVVNCKSITITGYAGNSVTVYAGFNSSLPSDGTDGEEINANISKVYTGNIDPTKLYIICASSTPKVSWIASDVVGGLGAGGSSASSGTVDLASDVTGVLPTANGGAPATRVIELFRSTYRPSPDGGSNSGILADYDDRVNYVSYSRWTSGTASQDYDIVYEFIIPTDFASFSASALSIAVRSNDYAGNPLTISMYDGSNSVDAGVSAADIKPSANDTWQTKTDTPTASYSAGDICHILIHMGNDEANNTIDVAKLKLTYNTR